MGNILSVVGFLCLGLGMWSLLRKSRSSTWRFRDPDYVLMLIGFAFLLAGNIIGTDFGG
jgi:hypothetical protein